MFNFEQAINDWRQRMLTAGIADDSLKELESHLREDITTLMRSGMDAEPAFVSAKSRLGSVASLRCEFRKSHAAHYRPLNVIFALWLAMTFLLFLKIRDNKTNDPQLTFHIIALTCGYLAAVVAGTFGICHVALQLFNQLTSRRRDVLICGIKRFNRIAAVCTVLGLVFGLLWSARNSQNFLVPPYPEIYGMRFAMLFKEFGAFAVALLILAAAALQELRPASRPTLVPLSIIANMLVGLSWAGPYLIWDKFGPHFSIGMYWPFQLFVLLNAIFLCLSFVRRAPAEDLKMETSSYV